MAVIDFADLQLLSGYKQVSKVIDFLRSNRIPYVMGGDGKPRTTKDLLDGALTDEQAPTTEVRFS